MSRKDNALELPSTLTDLDTEVRDLVEETRHISTEVTFKSVAADLWERLENDDWRFPNSDDHIEYEDDENASWPTTWSELIKAFDEATQEVSDAVERGKLPIAERDADSVARMARTMRWFANILRDQAEGVWR